MAWIQDSTKSLDIGIGNGIIPPIPDDKWKWIIIAAIIVVIGYFLLKETGKKAK